MQEFAVTMPEHEMPERSIQYVRGLRISTATSALIHETCGVVTERPLTLTIEEVGSYTLMCTPTDPVALAVGFAFTEGIISSIRDIDILYHCEDDPSTIYMRLGRLPERLPERNMLVASSCGLCGSMHADELLAALPPVGHSLHLSTSVLLGVFAAMRTRQILFTQTGGTHAAAIFTADGEIIAFAEDLGRHNALDKCIGLCCLTGKSMAGCGAALSGRVSLEMVSKAARAGLEVVAAVSAPSSLAVAAAECCQMTLCGFVRDDRVTIYSHEARIEEAPR